MPRQPWHRELLARFVYLWPLKAVGTALFIVVFFRAYFFVLSHPGRPVTVMPEIALDHWVGFTPLAFPVYVSLWVYVALAPALLGSFGALLRYGIWVALLCAVCLSLFWAFPTQVPEVNLDWANYPGMDLLKSVDSSGNACPSLHVASAVFSALWLRRLLKTMRAPDGWARASDLVCLAITWSTLATRQHVALDAIAGAAMGWLFAWLSLRHASAATLSAP